VVGATGATGPTGGGLYDADITALDEYELIYKDDSGLTTYPGIGIDPNYPDAISIGGLTINNGPEFDGGIEFQSFVRVSALDFDNMTEDLLLFTSGTATMYKVAEVITIDLSGNMTISGFDGWEINTTDAIFSNMRFSRFYFRQGSTGYTVTFPTGSDYRYAGNISTISSAANTVTEVRLAQVSFETTPVFLIDIGPQYS
jgi:hypothetical protein